MISYSYLSLNLWWFVFNILCWTHRLLILSISPQFIAVSLVPSTEVPCLNERVTYYCTVQGLLLEWRIDPQNLEMTLARSHTAVNSSSNWTLPGGLVFVVTLTSANATSMSSTIEFVALPEFQGTVFTCSGRKVANLVLDIVTSIKLRGGRG